MAEQTDILLQISYVIDFINLWHRCSFLHNLYILSKTRGDPDDLIKRKEIRLQANSFFSCFFLFCLVYLLRVTLPLYMYVIHHSLMHFKTSPFNFKRR